MIKAILITVAALNDARHHATVLRQVYEHALASKGSRYLKLTVLKSRMRSVVASTISVSVDPPFLNPPSIHQ